MPCTGLIVPKYHGSLLDRKAQILVFQLLPAVLGSGIFFTYLISDSLAASMRKGKELSKGERISDDPLVRTKKLFGGLIKDVKRRLVP